MEDGTTRLIFRVPQPLLHRIDRYWHERRLPSRAAGVRELLEAALKDAAPTRPVRPAPATPAKT